MNLGIIMTLVGGLGLFLYGMKLMSDALEKAAGAKMRSILEFFTKTPLRGILVGTFFTAVIQSSSASTVMVVSFVNSGLMNLYQAAGVIMGANIGTTVNFAADFFESVCACAGNRHGRCGYGNVLQKNKDTESWRGSSGLRYFVYGTFRNVRFHVSSS